jgi:hypothetical protein
VVILASWSRLPRQTTVQSEQLSLRALGALLGSSRAQLHKYLERVRRHDLQRHTSMTRLQFHRQRVVKFAEFLHAFLPKFSAELFPRVLFEERNRLAANT